MIPKRGSSIAVTALVLVGAAVAAGFVFRSRPPRSTAAPAPSASPPRELLGAWALASASATAVEQAPSVPSQRSEWDRAAAVTMEHSGSRGDPTAGAPAPRASGPGRQMPPGMQPTGPNAGAPGTQPLPPAEQQRARTLQRIEDDPRIAPYLAASHKLHLDEDQQNKLVALLRANSRPFGGAASEGPPAALDTPEGIRAHAEAERRLEPSLRALLGPAKTSELLTMVTIEQLQHRPATPQTQSAR